MASVADCAKAAFERYYDGVMPLLRSALTAEGGDKQQARTPTGRRSTPILRTFATLHMISAPA